MFHELLVTKIKIIAVYLNPYHRVSLSCLTFRFVLNIMSIMFTRIDHVRVSSQREKIFLNTKFTLANNFVKPNSFTKLRATSRERENKKIRECQHERNFECKGLRKYFIKLCSTLTIGIV